MATENTDSPSRQNKYTVYLVVYLRRLGCVKKPTFGEHLRAFRKSRGLTMEALATAAGTTKTTIYRIETGRRTQISWSMATAIADALGVGVERFRESEITKWTQDVKKHT